MRISLHALSVAFGIFVILGSAQAGSGPQLTPDADPNFLSLTGGRVLSDVMIDGRPLELAHGKGEPFTESLRLAFEQLRRATKANPNHPVQWMLMDLDAHRVVDSSAAPDRKQFGASVSKIFVAATLLDKQGGAFSNSQLQLLSEMLVVSSNEAWFELQNIIGDGSDDLGRERIQSFTQRMGYARTRAFQGWWGNIHGNELTAREITEFLYDTYQNNYPGAETVWKIMHVARNDNQRGTKYLPLHQYVAGKTGVYDGETVDPESGSATFPDGSPFEVRVRHHALFFKAGGREYGLAILANTGTTDAIQLLAGGIYRELAEK